MHSLKMTGPQSVSICDAFYKEIFFFFFLNDEVLKSVVVGFVQTFLGIATVLLVTPFGRSVFTSDFSLAPVLMAEVKGPSPIPALTTSLGTGCCHGLLRCPPPLRKWKALQQWFSSR